MKTNKKINVNQTVWHALQSDLAIQKDISRKIINTRALAKFIIKKYGLTVSLDSIISAVRRFQTQGIFEEEEKLLHEIFREAVVRTKNNVACLTISTGTNPPLLKKLCNSCIENIPFRISTGIRELKFVVEHPYLEKVKSLFDKEQIKKIEEDLSEISVVVDEKASHTKGVIGRMTSELALSNINIHEIIVCPPEFLIYVKEKDIVKAHETVLQLCRERQKSLTEISVFVEE